MLKKYRPLVTILFVLVLLLAASAATYSMNKTDKIPSLGCDAKSLLVQKSGSNWIIKWKYDPRLEGTLVKINLYRNGKLMRAVTDSVSIGQKGNGTWQGAWGDFFYTSLDPAKKLSDKAFGNLPWMVRGVDDAPNNKNKFTGVPKYQIEIVSLADTNLKIMGDSASWDWGN